MTTPTPEEVAEAMAHFDTTNETTLGLRSTFVLGKVLNSEVRRLERETADVRKHYGALVSQAQEGQNRAEAELAKLKAEPHFNTRSEWRRQMLGLESDRDSLRAKLQKAFDMVESALMLSMDGECDTCGYDGEHDTDKHSEDCEAHALELDLQKCRDEARRGR